MSADPRADAQSVSASPAGVEAERSGNPFLVFRDGDDKERVFQFEPSSVSASVGRRSSSDLALGWDDQVSRSHARFERVDDAWVLIDDGLSSNGTFVNGERLQGTRRLNDGDVLRFGTTIVTFRSPRRQQPPEPEAPAAARTPQAVALSTTQRRVLLALARPYKGGNAFATPATDQQIADELVLSLAEVRAHLRVLYAKLGLEEHPTDARVRLVERAFSDGLISDRDL